MTHPHDPHADTWYGSGNWLPSPDSETVNDTETPEVAESPGYTCSRCRSGKHERCREVSCTCCAGGDY